jgi:hypothetical protein
MPVSAAARTYAGAGVDAAVANAAARVMSKSQSLLSAGQGAALSCMAQTKVPVLGHGRSPVPLLLMLC